MRASSLPSPFSPASTPNPSTTPATLPFANLSFVSARPASCLKLHARIQRKHGDTQRGSPACQASIYSYRRKQPLNMGTSSARLQWPKPSLPCLQNWDARKHRWKTHRSKPKNDMLARLRRANHDTVQIQTTRHLSLLDACTYTSAAREPLTFVPTATCHWLNFVYTQWFALLIGPGRETICSTSAIPSRIYTPRASLYAVSLSPMHLTHRHSRIPTTSDNAQQDTPETVFVAYLD